MNIHVQIYQIWTSGSGGDVVKRYFFSGALAPLLFICAISVEGNKRNNSVKLF